jgi:hypothetical protein
MLVLNFEVMDVLEKESSIRVVLAMDISFHYEPTPFKVHASKCKKLDHYFITSNWRPSSKPGQLLDRAIAFGRTLTPRSRPGVSKIFDLAEIWKNWGSISMTGGAYLNTATGMRLKVLSGPWDALDRSQSGDAPDLQTKQRGPLKSNEYQYRLLLKLHCQKPKFLCETIRWIV